MRDLRFSVVVPTRDRPRTLEHTLRTCLEQDFDGYEVVVCDNGSGPATRAVVERLGSPRIKYVRSDRPLAMSENWELGVARASGEYVTVLGDDDGLLRHALRSVDAWLTAFQAKLLRWERAQYHWPDTAVPENANRVFFPLLRSSRVFTSRAVLSRLGNFGMDWTMLPTLYNGAAHRDLVSALRRKTGRVFAGVSPDLYSGFALAYLAGRFGSIGRVVTVSGMSAGSTGMALIRGGPRSPIAAEFRRRNASAGIDWHPGVPDMPVLPALVADAFARAKDALFAADRVLRLDRRRLALNCFDELDSGNTVESQDGMDAIRKWLADDAPSLRWFEARVRDRARASSVPVENSGHRREWGRGFDGMNLWLDTAEFGVSDVAGLVELCEKIVGEFGCRDDAGRLSVAGRVRVAARILVRGRWA